MNGSLPYVRRHITVKKTFPSFIVPMSNNNNNNNNNNNKLHGSLGNCFIIDYQLCQTDLLRLNY